MDREFAMSMYASEKDLYKAKAEYYEGLYRKAPEWISVEDRLPVDPAEMSCDYSVKTVIVLTEVGNVFCTDYNCGKLPEPWCQFGDWVDGHIIKWQPLPQPPKEA